MSTHSVVLTEEEERFIEEGVAARRFADVSEAVREGLRLLEERDREEREKIERLRAAAKVGFDAIDRGEYATLRSRQEIEDFLSGIREEVLAKRAAKRARA